MCQKGQKTADIYILGVYTLLFPWEEREIPGEEENQQEEVCKEMQGGSPDNPGHEDTTVSGHHKENEPDTCWLLPLLRYHRQHRQPEKLPATNEKEPV